MNMLEEHRRALMTLISHNEQFHSGIDEWYRKLDPLFKSLLWDEVGRYISKKDSSTIDIVTITDAVHRSIYALAQYGLSILCEKHDGRALMEREGE